MNPLIDQCIKCSICNAFCPVLKTSALFPGPKLAGPDAERFRGQRKVALQKWLDLCDYCKICERMCPHNVSIPDLHIQSRMRSPKRGRLFLRDRLLGHSYYFQRLASLAAPAANRILSAAFVRFLLDRGLGIDRRANFPLFQRQTFSAWFGERPPARGFPISYFHGCHTNYIDPDIGKAVVEVLEKNGFRVTLPRQECCGLPLISNGFFRPAAKLAEKNLHFLKRSVAEGMEIVFSSPSCGMTLTQEYKTVLHLAEASVLAENTYEISQFLLRLYEEGRLNTNFKEIKATYFYHAPCHLRALQIGLPALEVLSLIPGLSLVELPEACCGLAGTYGFKKENYDGAREIGEELFQAVRRSGSRTVISECEACRLQISAHTGVQTLHPVQILRQAYGA